MKGADLKRLHSYYDSNYVAFQERKNNGGSKEISSCQGFWEGGGWWKEAGLGRNDRCHPVFKAVKLFYTIH